MPQSIYPPDQAQVEDQEKLLKAHEHFVKSEARRGRLNTQFVGFGVAFLSYSFQLTHPNCDGGCLLAGTRGPK